MSKNTLVLSLIIIFILIGVISLVPMPMPLPAPHTPAASSPAATGPVATVPATAAGQVVLTPVTPLPPTTPSPRATHYVEPTFPAVLPTVVPTTPPELVIPDLDIDQPIVPVAIQDGIWDLSQLGEQVGWLTTTGQHPEGELAVALVGHVNIALGHPGPFVNLKQLELYDQVIYRANGVDYVYSVQGFEKVEPDAVDQLYVPDGKRLLLVTCSDWSYFWSHYARRLIVTAKLLDSVPSP
jgi:LPXTG-site transpeptidase (sortase) family protein